MAWVPQHELDAAVDAMVACAQAMTMHDHRRLKILHPARNVSRQKWENIICAMLASTSDRWDSVLPENCYLQQLRGNENAA